jgi:hypothetical protein
MPPQISEILPNGLVSVTRRCPLEDHRLEHAQVGTRNATRTGREMSSDAAT